MALFVLNTKARPGYALLIDEREYKEGMSAEPRGRRNR